VSARCGPTIFDAMIAASALHAHCDTLWSEDMQHGMTLENRLRIANPIVKRSDGG
jgi:predicted nucleic acid-binding protein